MVKNLSELLSSLLKKQIVFVLIQIYYFIPVHDKIQ